MKRILPSLALTLFAVSPTFGSSDVGFDVNIGISNQPKVIAAPSPATVYAPQPVIIEEPPLFLLPPTLGFHVAVGIPQDLFFISNSYYLYHGRRWYRAPYYNGPWVSVHYSKVPPGIRKHKVRRIHDFRYREYRIYRHDREQYRGRHFRPDRHHVEEMRKEKLERLKDDRKWEEELRKEELERQKAERKWEEERRKEELERLKEERKWEEERRKQYMQ